MLSLCDFVKDGEGNAYSQIIRNSKGEVVGLYPLMPDRMTVKQAVWSVLGGLFF